MLFFDREVLCHPEDLERAFVSILDCSNQTLSKHGYIRVITRPKGLRVEVEISDSGSLHSSLFLGQVSFNGEAVRNLVISAVLFGGFFHSRFYRIKALGEHGFIIV